MKKLKLKKSSFADAEVLSRAQLRKVMGGDAVDVYECSGDKWNGTTFRFEKETKNCAYAPPIGTLPGAYICPLTTGYYNVTGCSKKFTGGVGSGTGDV